METLRKKRTSRGKKFIEDDVQTTLFKYYGNISKDLRPWPAFPSSLPCQETETCMGRACHTLRQNHPSRHLWVWGTQWSEEEMLDGQRQSSVHSFPCRNFPPGPSAEKTRRESLPNRPSCPPDDPIGQGTELNRTEFPENIQNTVNRSSLWSDRGHDPLFTLLCVQTRCTAALGSSFFSSFFRFAYLTVLMWRNLVMDHSDVATEGKWGRVGKHVSRANLPRYSLLRHFLCLVGLWSVLLISKLLYIRFYIRLPCTFNMRCVISLLLRGGDITLIEAGLVIAGWISGRNDGRVAPFSTVTFL